MRRPTTGSPAHRRRLAAVLLATLVLTLGTACSWGDDSTSGGDTAQTGGADGEGSGSDGGGEDGGGDGGGGSKGSPIELARATERQGNGEPVWVIAAEAAGEMAAVCPGRELCVEIAIQPDDDTCMYSHSDPDPNKVDVINVGATLTLFGDCSVHYEPDPGSPDGYREVEESGKPSEGTDEPSDGTDEELSESTDGEPNEDAEEEPTEGTDEAPPEDDQG
jgi:hypothetical protein